jgi:hypothetical protein
MHDAEWRRSTRCGESGQCVEIADLGESVAMRDGADPDGPALSFTRSGWSDFVAGLVWGEFRPI